MAPYCQNQASNHHHFLCFNYGKEGAGIISRLRKHTLLFSRQKEPEMIDRSKTLSMISRNKISYEGKAQQLETTRSSTFSLLISTLGRENGRDGVAITSSIWIPYSCLFCVACSYSSLETEELPLINFLPYFKSHKGNDEPFDICSSFTGYKLKAQLLQWQTVAQDCQLN